jgi:hypothetical protein
MTRAKLTATTAAGLLLLAAAGFFQPAVALDAAGWRSQQIYQVRHRRRPLLPPSLCFVT